MVGDHMGIPRTVVLFLLYGIMRHICARPVDPGLRFSVFG
jgi:hypothetical protein